MNGKWTAECERREIDESGNELARKIRKTKENRIRKRDA